MFGNLQNAPVRFALTRSVLVPVAGGAAPGLTASPAIFWDQRNRMASYSLNHVTPNLEGR